MFRSLLLLVCLCIVLVVPVAAQDAPPAVAEPAFRVEEVVKADMVTSIVFTADGSMYWTEKLGVVRRMAPDGTVQADPVVQVEAKTDNEQGLLSIAFDPKFEENRLFYIFYTRLPIATQKVGQDVIVRYRMDETYKGVEPVQLLAIDLPDNDRNEHNGGRLRFAADGSLYYSLGDLGFAAAGQDTASPLAKIHRVIVAGNQLVAAPGNPQAGQSMWAMGVRNTFSFAFDPVSKGILATENGPACDDEINLIYPGQNYGWGLSVNCDNPLPLRQIDGRPPLISWTPTVAPTGIMVYDGDAFPAWKGQVFFCTFKTFGPYHVQMNEKHTQFAGDPVLLPLQPGQECFIEIMQGPDGYIYYSHISAIYRLVPAI